MTEIELPELQEVEALAQLIEQLQRAANKAVRHRGLKGDEFHPLNIIDLGLFGLLMQAKLAAGTLGEGQDKGETVKT